MRVILMALAMLLASNSALSYGDIVLTPRLSLAEDDKFAPSVGLLVDHTIVFVNYYSLTELAPYPVPGDGYYYDLSTKQGIKFDAVDFSLMPYYSLRHSFPEDFSRHELGIQFTYRLWR